MQAMWMTKVKLAAGAALSVAVLGAGTGWVLAPATAHDGIVLAATAQDEKQPPAKSPAPSSPQKSWEVAEKEAMELLQNAIKSVEQTSPLAKAQPNDDALRSLIKERHRTAVLELTLRLHVFKAGARGGSIEVLLGSADRAYESEIALVTSNAEKLKAAQRSVEIATAILAVNKSRREVGQIADQDVEQSRYYMLGTQIRLMQAEQKVAK